MTATSLRDKAREELRVYAIVAGYLYVCFAALLIFEASMQPAAGSPLLPHGFAAIKALVLGKFLLIGRAVGAGMRLPTTTVVGRIGLRTLALLAVVLLLTIIEEMIVGAIHGHAVTESLAAIFGASRYALLAKLVVMAVVLLPLVTLEELDRALGAGVLRRTLLGRPTN